jgi:hypothetical protein
MTRMLDVDSWCINAFTIHHNGVPISNMMRMMIHDAPTSSALRRDESRRALDHDAPTSSSDLSWRAWIHDAPTSSMRGGAVNRDVHWITTRQRPACARGVLSGCDALRRAWWTLRVRYDDGRGVATAAFHHIVGPRRLHIATSLPRLIHHQAA